MINQIYRVLLAITLFCTLSLATHANEQAKQDPLILNGHLWVVNKRADNVSIVDIASGQIINTLATGKGPHELAIDSTKRKAVVTDYVGGNSLTVFDVANQQLDRTIPLAQYPRPHGVLFMPDQRRVAVSSEGSDSALIVNIYSGKVETVMPTHAQGSHMVALPASGQVVYTTNMTSNSVSVLNPITAKLLDSIAMPTTPEAVTVSDDNQLLWVGSNKDGWLSVYDTQSKNLVSRWKDYTWPYRILYSPDQQYVVVPDLRQHTLDVYRAKNQQRLMRITLPKGVSPKGLVFHPQHPVVFLSLYDANQIAVIDITTGKTLLHLPTGDGPDGIGYVDLSGT